MEAEGSVQTVQTPAKAGGRLKLWHLITLFLFLLILIVGLVVWVIINHKNTGGEEEVACEEMETGREIMSCLSREEEGEALDERYDATLEKAFEEEDYEFFDDVILDRTENLVLKDECDKTLSWLESLESKYSAKLPIMDLYGFYVSGKEAALECGNSDKLTYYQNKIDTILSSDEYSTAVANDDYRVYGEDIFVEDEEGGL